MEGTVIIQLAREETILLRERRKNFPKVTEKVLEPGLEYRLVSLQKPWLCMTSLAPACTEDCAPTEHIRLAWPR